MTKYPYVKVKLAKTHTLSNLNFFDEYEKLTLNHKLEIEITYFIINNKPGKLV